MVPSAKIQSRIQAFEALSSNYPPYTHKTPSHEPHDLLEEPISPTAKSFFPITPSIPNTTLPPSPSPSPPNLGRKTSLIDLKDWVVDDGPGKPAFGSSSSHYTVRRPPPPPRRADPPEQVSSAPLISLQAPLEVKLPPPIPPKMRSHNSPRGQLTTNDELATKRSDSLTAKHTYPPFLSLETSSRPGLRHAPVSSISSFHSVSLSDNENGSVSNRTSTHSMDRDGDADSLDESFENVSAISSPSTFVSYDSGSFENMTATSTHMPPKLPERPKPRLAPSSAYSPPASPQRYNGTSGGLSRRLPPPPPRPGTSRPHSARTSFTSTTASDRSSILSTATTATSRTSSSTSTSMQPPSQVKLSLQLTRPSPVPMAAKQRYESVFLANVRVRRKADKSAVTSNVNSLAPNSASLAVPGRQTRKAAGWRGLSVDLTTNSEEHLSSDRDADSGASDSLGLSDPEDAVDAEERLDGSIVRRIWSTSRLERVRLRDIWNDCDPDQSGSLDIDAFVKGMWRIDEELRRAQLGTQSRSVHGSGLGRRQARRADSSFVPR